MTGEPGSQLNRVLAAAAAFCLAAVPCKAAAIWCGVPDVAEQKLFASNPVAVPGISKLVIWRYSARFVDAINGRYAAHLPPDDLACRAADSMAAADRALLKYRNDQASLGLTLVIVGIF
jgi:hypothetical protein